MPLRTTNRAAVFGFSHYRGMAALMLTATHPSTHSLCLGPLSAPQQGVLRTRETIERFKRVPTQPGQTSPLLIYFGTILTKSSLNADESVELGTLVMAQNKKPLLDNWWKVREQSC